MDKILITLAGPEVAPRFDLCPEVLIARAEAGKLRGEPRTVLLPGPSADDLCGLILKEEISLVICGGIEEPHYQYLTWKKIKVIDRVIGRLDDILPLALAGQLPAGAIIRPQPDREGKQ